MSDKVALRILKGLEFTDNVMVICDSKPSFHNHFFAVVHLLKKNDIDHDAVLISNEIRIDTKRVCFQITNSIVNGFNGIIMDQDEMLAVDNVTNKTKVIH